MDRRIIWGGGALVALVIVTLMVRGLSGDAPARALAATAPTQTSSLPAAMAFELGKDSGLPVPRFVSLKTQRVNVRRGPSNSHPIAWQFQRAGMPVEITGEFENWRMIRDSDGEEGWVFHSLLSGQRTAIVAPWDREERLRVLRDDASGAAGAVAQVEPQVVVDVARCDGAWCAVNTGGYSGYIEQEQLWGVYSGEAVGG